MQDYFSYMHDKFLITQKGSTVKTEVLAGITTFLTMSYIIFVNPTILAQTGMDYQSVFIATCIAAAIGTLIMGVYANLPFALAPGMGLNAFFTFTVVFGLGYTWQQGLAIVFLSGVLFLILTVTGVRRIIIDAIPTFLKLAITPGIGLFIALIGLNNAGVIDVNQGPIIDIILQQESLDKDLIVSQINQAPPQIIQLGKLTDPAVLLTIIGFIILTIFMILNTKAGMIWAVILTTVIGIPLGVTQLPESYDISSIDMSPTAFQLDIAGLFSSAGEGMFWSPILSVLVVIISFTMVDLLDTLGTLIGTASKGDLLDDDGNVPRMNQALFADATATTIGALLGTSSVTTYIESGSGIIAGGKTGLTAITTAVLFLAAILLAPIASIVPVAATSPILIMVGLLMMDGIKKINLDRLDIAIPASLLIIMMPFSYSIANGIALGLMMHVLIQLVQGNIKKIHPILIILVFIFLLKYVII